jgi:hypothetical protein
VLMGFREGGFAVGGDRPSPVLNITLVTWQVSSKTCILNKKVNCEKLEERDGAICGSLKGSKNRRA